MLKYDSISIAIITKNEEKNIVRLLSSVTWADEIVIVDSGSSDRTVDLAKEYGAKIFYNNWLGYGIQKNFAISKCSCNWILFLDADEEVTPELKKNIQQILENNNSNSNCYKLKRISCFCGKWIYYGDWGRDFVTRFFRKNSAKYSNDIIHERLLTDTKPMLIQGILKHYSQNSINQALDKLNQYSTATSKILFSKNASSGLLKANLHKYWAFLRAFILRLGFLDGIHGYLVAKLNAYGSFFKYIKLWESNNSYEKKDR